MDIMKNFLNGETLRVVETGEHDSVKELAIEFLLYGAMAEIFARKTGFNRGLGGSMHTFFTPFGIYPNNAIVGGSAGIAAGAALFKRVNRKGGIVVANIGDGSLGCGPVLEALNFASMGQFDKLWEEGFKGGLPVLFNIFNNQYGMGGQTNGETMGYDVLARLGAGFAVNQMHAERVDGYNPLAVIEAVGRKKDLLLKGQGPVLLDVVTYRYAGHSPSDASSYRTQEEMAAWKAVDPLVTYRAQLVEAGVATEAECDAIAEHVKELIFKSFKRAIDDSVSPRMDLHAEPDAIANMMFSNGHVEKFSDAQPDVLMPMSENPRVQAIAKKERYYMKDGKPVSKNRVYQLRDGLFEAIIDRFYKDPTLVAYGEENRDWGGAFAVYRGLTEALPYHRLFNAPISEAAIVGNRRRLRHGGRPRAGRADVLRLPGPRGRRSVQPDVQVAGHVRRHHQNARGAPRVRGFQVRRAAFSGLDRAHRAHSGPQGRVPGHAVRREGPDGFGARRHRSRGVLREPAHLRYRRNVPRGRRAGRVLRDRNRQAGYQEAR